jgi:peptidoglycan/xylan/chitin deacetylase (PgdA/CDA1 family)
MAQAEVCVKDVETGEVERGCFTLSLDLELIWGTLDLFGPERFRSACEKEREEVIDRLLALLVEFGISATWCALGHLFLDGCESRTPHKHPEIVRPAHRWHRRDWFVHDPGGSETEHPTFFGRSLIGKILNCPVPQEIGCHSFSHVIFGDDGCSRETALSEVSACVELARGLGIVMKSFAFPRDQVGHLDVLREYGFICYRGAEPHWYEKTTLPTPVKRLARLWEVLTAAQPPTVLPERTAEGMWNIPGSMIYFPMHGLRRFIPRSLRVNRVIKGLDAAARNKRIFHLWFHPTNLAVGTEAMFAGLRAVFEYACALRDRGALAILPMAKLAPFGATVELSPAETRLPSALTMAAKNS